MALLGFAGRLPTFKIAANQQVHSFPWIGCICGGLLLRGWCRIKMCPWIAEGYCRHGDLCNYAHTPEQLRPWLPLYKTKLCDAFKRVWQLPPSH